jgi:hypothetical protein
MCRSGYVRSGYCPDQRDGGIRYCRCAWTRNPPWGQLPSEPWQGLDQNRRATPSMMASQMRVIFRDFAMTALIRRAIPVTLHHSA